MDESFKRHLFFNLGGDCMSSKKIFSFAFAITFAGLSILVLSNQGNAQGRYANVYSKSQVGAIIKRAEDSSDKFRTDFRRQMNNNNNLSSSQRAEFNGYVANCEEALDRLRSRFNSENNWWNTRNQVQDAINSSQQVNTMMNVLPFRRNLESQWNRLRDDINKLADTFDLPGLNGGGWNGGGWNGGGQTSTPPSWAQGTFYSTNGTNITLTIARNGRVTVINGGQTFYGTYYRNNITVNSDISTVSRNGNNIRTYNRSTGQTTDYSRNGWGGGTGPGWGGGNTSTPPSWAQGTFYSPGRAITVTINRNGQVTAITGGQTFYGTYYNGLITLNNDVSTVSRNGNGISTYNQNTGQNTNYRRQ